MTIVSMAKRRSVLIVVNPTSGRGRGRRIVAAVAQLLRSRGCEVAIRHTQRRGDAQGITCAASASASERPDVILACGGDGTVQEVVNALAPLRTSLGSNCSLLALAPTGRCNDFARAFGIRSDPRIIADAVTNGATAEVDLGCVNGRYFCTVATLGADAEVSEYVDRMWMPMTGTPAYVYGAICVLPWYRSKRVRISGDFGEMERSVFIASSANTSSYGGAIPIAPHAVPTDGMLDLCLIDAVSRVKAMWLLPTVFTGRHVNLPSVHFIRTARFRLEAEDPLDLWADGERLARTPVDVAVASAAVRLAVPPGFKAPIHETGSFTCLPNGRPHTAQPCHEGKDPATQ